jgi:hypothetical protein
MIPSWREIVYGIFGAWRLLRLDPKGMTYFDTSLEGFWKSFFAAVLIAPAHAIIVAMELSKVETTVHPGSILILQVLAYVISWMAFPLAVFYLTRNMGRAAHYLGYIVAYNWSSLIQMVILLPLSLLAESAVLPEALASLVGLAAFIVVLGYLWFIARTALDITGFPAAGLVLLSLVIDLFIRGVTDNIIL